MRFLMTFAGGTGHFLPTLPIAHALLRSGHFVAYACQEAMMAAVAAEGFPVFDTGGSTLAKPNVRLPLLRLDRRAEEQVIRAGFAGRIASERTPALIALAEHWQPDVVVRDETDFGAAIAAEVCGIRHAAVIVIAAGGFLRPDLLADPLATLREKYGLEPDPSLTMLHRHLSLAPVPVSFRDPLDPLPATAFHLRPAIVDRPDLTEQPGRSGQKPQARNGRPTVYFTLGTVFHQESGDLFPRVLAGLADKPLDVIVSVGREIDPFELGQQPTNIRIVRYVDPLEVLPHCDAVICHGGSGSVLGALAFGLPCVLLPMGADQPLNADRCEALGVARVLDSWSASPTEIAEAVSEVIAEPSYRRCAQLLQAEIASLPGCEELLPIVTALAPG